MIEKHDELSGCRCQSQLLREAILVGLLPSEPDRRAVHGRTDGEPGSDDSNLEADARLPASITDAQRDEHRACETA